MKAAKRTIIFNEELCTVGHDHAVVTWVTDRPCPGAAVHFGENPSRLDKAALSDGGQYHLAELTGLKPSSRYWYRVESGGARGPLNCLDTLPAPPGRLLFRFGIITDTHVCAGKAYNDPNRMFFGKLSEFAGTLLSQAISDIRRRNVDMAVFTGDFTDTGDYLQYVDMRSKLELLGNVPCLLGIGNHDKFTRFGGVGERGFYDYLADRGQGYQCVLFNDHTFIVLDSCRVDENKGYLPAEQLRWLEDRLNEGGGRPALIFLHHPAHGFDLWFGLTNHREFTAIIDRHPNVWGVFCGHLHRNKITAGAGAVPYVEVCATVQYPCGYAVAGVYEGGFTYNAYKVSRIDLSEMSRERFILKDDDKALLTWYSFGGPGDRSFCRFNGHLHQPRLYELFFATDHHRALALYQQTQPVQGASLTPVGAGVSMVLLGSFPAPDLAENARQRAWVRYGIKARVNGRTGTGPRRRL